MERANLSIAAAEKRELIVFEKRTESADARGNDGDFSEQFSRFCKLRPVLGGETIRALQQLGTQTFNLTVAADSQTRTIATGWRARNAYSGAKFNIKAIVPLGIGGRDLEMTVTSGETA